MLAIVTYSVLGHEKSFIRWQSRSVKIMWHKAQPSTQLPPEKQGPHLSLVSFYEIDSNSAHTSQVLDCKAYNS